MIILFTPEQMKQMTKEREDGSLLIDLSDKYGAKTTTISRNIKLFKDKGLWAFSPKMIKPELNEMFKGLTLDEAYLIYVKKSGSTRTKQAFRRVMQRIGIEYNKREINRVLTPESKSEIKLRLKRGNFISFTRLANEYNVEPSVVINIAKRMGVTSNYHDGIGSKLEGAALAMIGKGSLNIHQIAELMNVSNFQAGEFMRGFRKRPNKYRFKQVKVDGLYHMEMFEIQHLPPGLNGTKPKTKKMIKWVKANPRTSAQKLAHEFDVPLSRAYDCIAIAKCKPLTKKAPKPNYTEIQKLALGLL